MRQGLPNSEYRPGPHSGISATTWLWLLAIGIAQIALWPHLPEPSAGFWIGYLALVTLLIFPIARRRTGSGKELAAERNSARISVRTLCIWLLPCVLGAGWGLYWDRAALDNRLPLTLHGADADVTLKITALPDVRPATFNFGRVRSADGERRDVRFPALVESSDVSELVGQKLLLTWYGTNRASQIRAGSRWQARLRIKRPRGNVNPATFDYEAWLLQQGYFATGYLRDRDLRPHLLDRGAGLNALRESLRDRVQSAGLDQGRLVRALLLGDKSGLTDADQQLLRDTGTSHLLAISGLHVGMVAGFFLFIGGLWARLWGLYRPRNPRLGAGVIAVTAAIGYTLICGAPLSAQRALIMTVVGIAAWIWRRRVSPGLAFALALALVLLLQPLAVLNAGFWLSFTAVAALLLCFGGRQRVASQKARAFDPQSSAMTRLTRGDNFWLTAVRSQWVVLLALLLPSLIFFTGVSRSGLLVNLIAIPWLGLLILPPILLGTLLSVSNLEAGCWQFADWQLGLLFRLLQWSQDQLPSWQWLPAPGLWVAALALVSVLLLLLPRGFPGRLLGWCLLPVLLAGAIPWRSPPPASLKISILDVGQGLAVAVMADGRSVVLDTGEGMPDGWSAGRSVVAPFLLGQGVTVLDALVVSHGDRDHAGGASGLMDVLPVAELIAPGALGERLVRHQPVAVPVARCRAGDRVQLGGLTISWLWPSDDAPVSGEENDHSCVGILEWQGVRVLFTGDISRKVERQLARRYPGFAPVDLLIVPHHGSRTSTSADLLDWARPARAVFSAGFRHHFGHPHPSVVQRLLSRGVAVFSTADAGAVQFSWRPGAEAPDVECARGAAKFWRSMGPMAGCEE